MSRKNREAVREMRRNEVMDKLIGGRSYREMAEDLGVSLGTISNDVKVIFSRWRREQVKNIEDIVNTELRRLDRMLNAKWPDAVKGDTEAINTVLNIMRERAKLLGLYPPVRYSGETVTRHVFDHNAVVAAIAARSGGDRNASGEDQDHRGGTEVG